MLSFGDILGQKRAIETLTRAYLAERLPHGLIFAGPIGVGKSTTARALAALFLCESPKNTSPNPAACGKCTSCTALAANAHPDYHVITKELIRYHDKTGKSKGIDLSIHVIRPELIEPAARKPSLGRGKVFVVKEADAMNPQAQNALLKTLEEPAGRTLIILLTDQPGALLPTIRSRCQVIPFSALQESVVMEQLMERGIERKTATDAARISEGSLGQALKWIEDGVVAQSRELFAQLDAALTGRVPADLDTWFRKAAEEYAQKQLERDELASKDQATRDGLTLFLRLAGTHFRQAMQSTAVEEDLNRLCEAVDAIARAETYLWSNVSIPLVFQQLTIAWEREMSASGRGGN